MNYDNFIKLNTRLYYLNKDIAYYSKLLKTELYLEDIQSEIEEKEKKLHTLKTKVVSNIKSKPVVLQYSKY